MGNEIYCNWVNNSVDISLLAKNCIQYIEEEKCMQCARSDQIDLGMKPEDLLRNIRE